MALLAGTKLGPYEIIAPIGAGGMGEVYKATDTRLDRVVAIKVLPEHLSSNVELKQRFEREARAVASVNHPNICTLHDIGHEEGVDFMVMEYIEGETLRDRLQKGALPLGEALQHGIEIADALDKAHRQGVVHRDVKPGNVMVTKPGLKLLDFGLASRLRHSFGGQEPLSALPTEDKPLTREGAILGTFQYMSPEQLEAKEVDVRTDVFAFGAVLYEMVTGVARQASGWASFSVSTNGALAYMLEGVPRTTELLWLDRNGGLAGQAGAPARYGSVSLSPDGERLAVTQWDGDWDIWFVDTLRGTSTLFPGQNERHAYDIVWSPDESRIVFALDQDGPPNLFMRLADGSGEAERLFCSPMQTEPADWSPDGQLIVFQQRQRETGWDIGIVPVDPADGDRVPRMLLQTESEDGEPRFSPDGRYLAYVSDESGQNQVYVVRFPELDQKQRISVGGGEHLRWPREGRELFFLAPGGKLMATEVTTAPSFEANVPRLLFERSDVSTNALVGGPYDVTPDGQRILMNIALEERTSQPITIVLNWMAELDR